MTRKSWTGMSETRKELGIVPGSFFTLSIQAVCSRVSVLIRHHMERGIAPSHPRLSVSQGSVLIRHLREEFDAHEPDLHLFVVLAEVGQCLFE